MAKSKVLAMVLAGGEGKRLMPLTADRAKPAVPFGGLYRLIDFVLSNLVNGDFLKIVVLTQYKNHSLDRHISQTWRMSALLGNYVTPVPAQQRRGPRWFAGSADAIFQNFNLIEDEQPEHIIVFGADHIYRMDPRQMLDDHIAAGAGVTVAAIRQPLELADQFGVIETGPDGQQITRFLEKPKDAVGLPDAPHEVYASMGNYIFMASTLMDAVSEDALNPSSKHDMGGNIIPMLVERGEANVYDFLRNEVPGEAREGSGYWRDVGTLDAFFDAHMDLIGPTPQFDLFNRRWPIYTMSGPFPPACFLDEEGRSGRAVQSLVSPGARVAGEVRQSVLSPGVVVHAGAEVDAAVLMDGVRVGRGAVVRRAIVDKNVEIPDGAKIGVDLERDRERYAVTMEGIVVLGKNQKVEP